jgi:hypothetical protein
MFFRRRLLRRLTSPGSRRYIIDRPQTDRKNKITDLKEESDE